MTQLTVVGTMQIDRVPSCSALLSVMQNCVRRTSLMYKLVRNVLVPAEQAAVPAEQAEAAEQVEVCLLNCVGEPVQRR